MINKIFNKINNLIRRCLILKTYTTSSHAYADIFIKKDTNGEYITPYGIASNAPSGTLGYSFTFNGNSYDKGCMAYSSGNDFGELEEGETVFGNPLEKTYIKFRKDKKIEVFSDECVFKKGVFSIEEEANINSNFDVNYNVPKMNLGAGGAQIARVGDQVKVNIGGTDYFGEIISGGVNTSIW